MNQTSLENNRFITISLLILALVAVAFTLNFTKPNNDTFRISFIN